MRIRLLSRLRPLLKELRGIHLELTRMNDMRERELGYQGIHLSTREDVSGPDPEVHYTDEVSDYYRELAEELGKVGRPESAQAGTVDSTGAIRGITMTGL